jgi:poly(A) polymerase
LESPDPVRGIQLLKDTGLLPYVGQELQQMVGMSQNKWHSEDVFNHVMSVLQKTKPNLISRLGALLHDIGKVATRQVINGEVHFYNHENVGADIARKILTTLKYPNDIIEPVVFSIKNHMRLKQSGKQGEKLSDKAVRKLVVDFGDHLDDIMDIIHADNTSHSPEGNMPEQIPNILKRIEQLKSTIPNKNEKLPVTGDDLKRLGLSPGPLFGKLLGIVRDKQLETPNATKEEYLQLIKKYIEDEY